MTARSARMEKKGVLIIDSDEETKKIFRRVLDKNQYRLFTAGDSLEAMSLLKRRLPTLVVLNLHLTGIDAPQLLRNIKSLHRGGPILTIGRRLDDDTGSAAKELGVSGCIAKPILMQNLTSLLGHMLGSPASE